MVGGCWGDGCVGGCRGVGGCVGWGVVGDGGVWGGVGLWGGLVPLPPNMGSMGKRAHGEPAPQCWVCGVGGWWEPPWGHIYGVGALHLNIGAVQIWGRGESPAMGPDPRRGLRGFGSVGSRGLGSFSPTSALWGRGVTAPPGSAVGSLGTRSGDAECPHVPPRSPLQPPLLQGLHSCCLQPHPCPPPPPPAPPPHPVRVTGLCVNVCTHVCISARVGVHTYVRACAHVCASVCSRMCGRVLTYVRVCACG